nr:reverse transcriptase domain-containing protein [Tanacetum cinerariifolium]
MELDEHAPVYVLEPKHPEHHAPSDDDIQVKDDEEDPKEDPNEEHEPEDDDEDPKKDPNEEHEPEDEDTKEPFEGSDETEPFDEDKTSVTPPPSRHRGARIPAPLGHKTAMIRIRDDILEEDMQPQRRFVFTTPSLGCNVAESSAAAATRAPREARAQTDTVEDASSSCYLGTKGFVGLSKWLEKMESVFYISGCAIDNQGKFATCTLLGAALTWWNGHVRTLGHDVAYAMTWGTLKKKFTNKYYPKGEIKKLEIKLWNLRRKADDSSRNNQQQPHKKQNVARAYTAGPSEKKVYTGDLPLCTK